MLNKNIFQTICNKYTFYPDVDCFAIAKFLFFKLRDFQKTLCLFSFQPCRKSAAKDKDRPSDCLDYCSKLAVTNMVLDVVVNDGLRSNNNCSRSESFDFTREPRGDSPNLEKIKSTGMPCVRQEEYLNQGFSQTTVDHEYKMPTAFHPPIILNHFCPKFVIVL